MPTLDPSPCTAVHLQPAAPAHPATGPRRSRRPQFLPPGAAASRPCSPRRPACLVADLAAHHHQAAAAPRVDATAGRPRRRPRPRRSSSRRRRPTSSPAAPLLPLLPFFFLLFLSHSFSLSLLFLSHKANLTVFLSSDTARLGSDQWAPELQCSFLFSRISSNFKLQSSAPVSSDLRIRQFKILKIHKIQNVRTPKGISLTPPTHRRSPTTPKVKITKWRT